MFIKFLRNLGILCAGLCMISCSDDDDSSSEDFPPAPGEGLTFTVSKQVIQANGTDKTDFIVKFDGVVLTEDFSIFTDKDEKIENKSTFSTKETGEYKFWASYKSSHTELVAVKAISVPVPQLPADKAPERTDFTKRMLLTNFTGTGCGFCPKMTSLLKNVFSEPTYAENTIWCVAHTFAGAGDPMLLKERNQFESAFKISSYPTINVDFTFATTNYNIGVENLRAKLDEIYALPANAGISAKAELIDDKDGKKIALHVAVKAAEEGRFSVGAWLMEDSIKAPQAGLNKIIDHNNALRVVDSKAASYDYTGVKLGRIAKGKTAEHVFIMNLDEKWKLENCHMAIFVAETKDHKIYVTNAVRCPIEGELDFDYKK